MSGHGHSWWRSVLELDQLATLRQVAGPVLILQGGADASVSPQETLSMVARLRRRAAETSTTARIPAWITP